MIVYSHTITPRLKYLIQFLSEYFSMPINIVCAEEKFLTSKEECKINYSYRKLLDNELWINSHVLLFESFIRPVKIESYEHNNYKAFFKTEGDTGFDLFAATFYLISRYEEYLPHQTDAYGRYDHQNSLAFKEGFLHLPLVNIWLEDFRKLLKEKFPKTKFPVTEFKFTATYDIDMAWSYKNKGFKRNAGGIIQSIFKGNWSKVRERIKVLKNKIPDPYDSYDWMKELHQKNNLSPIYFFLVAQQKGKYDKNIDPDNKEFQNLLQSEAAVIKIGLHPSWASGETSSLIKKEKQILEQVTEQTINTSRQHFLRFSLPATYHKLIEAGITDEYSMGYGTINGFRASVADSYPWFDLKNDQLTNLMIHPFCFMDANSFYEQKFSTEEALQELMQYYSVIKSVNGKMIIVWHNSFLGTGKEFKGWREVYQKFIEKVAK